MSGLYNMLFGVNPLAGVLLQLLEIDHKTVPRFRDCFLNENGTEIIVYTRSGGNNRSEYVDENAAMRTKTGFVADQDDTYDSTYALFRFKIPEEPIPLVSWVLLAEQHGVDPAKRWEQAIKLAQEMKS